MAEPVSLSEIKLFARVDHDDDDALLTSLGVAAREFIETATGRDYSSAEAEVPERAKIAVLALVAHWYEFREVATIGQSHRVPMHIRSMIGQLRGGMLEPAEEVVA